MPTPLEDKLNMLVQNPGQFTEADRKDLREAHDATIKILGWMETHGQKHEEVDRRLNAHSGEIRDLNRDRWKGSAAVFAAIITFLSGIIGLIILKWK